MGNLAAIAFCVGIIVVGFFVSYFDIDFPENKH